MFKNRIDAGKALQKKVLAALNTRKPLQNVFVALPRGGVPVAAEIARELNAPLTVLVSKKIGAPFQPEFAIGAVSSSGVLVVNEDTGLPRTELDAHIQSERKRLTELTKKMEMKWLASAGLLQQEDFAGKRCIVIDDGIATGMTVLAACNSLRQSGAAEIIIATPVFATEARDLLTPCCDEIVCVLEPANLGAIGLFYEDFHQVADDEVLAALSSSIR